MTKILYAPLLALALLTPLTLAIAGDDKALQEERKAAEKERKTEQKERYEENRTAEKALKEFNRSSMAEYRERTDDLDTEFKLRRVELEADHEAKIAEAEAAYQKKLTALFMTPGRQFDEQTIAQMQTDGKAYSDELFALKKQFAEELHHEQVANEERKSALLTEREQLVLDKAAELGLTEKPAPILATPIGDGLTDREEKWNEKEQQEVEKLYQRNMKLLAEVRTGKQMRDLDIRYLKEDFKLTWEEKAELQALESRQVFYNTMLMQASTGGETNTEGFMAQMAELNKEKKLINIKYKKIREQNRIKRKEEKKELLAG